MNEYLKFIEDRILAFKISFIYVVFGTISVCSVYPKDLLYGEWSLFGLILTFPVSVLSFGYRYANPDLFYPVFIIQFIMFCVTFLILSKFITSKKHI